MPSPVHEIAVARLSQDPSLLPALAEKLLGRPPPAVLRPVDSAVRLANPEEVRPDLLLAHGKRGPWDAVEVQRRPDRVKARRWHLLIALLHDQRGRMGDLWVLTASRRTATWARAVCDAAGPNGTRIRVEPVVLLLGRGQVDALLDEERPSLAFFAAWAMQYRHGPEAEQVVERALAITDRLPDPLRRQQERDIVSVLNRRMVETLKEKIMDVKRNMESRWVREMRRELFADQMVEVRAESRAEGEREGEAKGKRDALLVVLKGRGLAISTSQRATILACSDPAALDRWLADSVKTTSVGELLAPAPTRKQGRARPAAARPSGAPRRRSARVG